MKRTILFGFLLFGLLICSVPSFGAVAHVTSAQGYCSATTFGGNIASTCSGVLTKTFTYTPNATSNGVLIMVGCLSNLTESSVGLTATGWTTITQVGSITGSTSSTWTALFKAYAPNTSAATFTVTWGASCNNNFMNDLIDEFSGVDQTNFIDCTVGTTCLAATAASGGCQGSVTPAGSNDGLWFGCQDNLTAVGGTYTKGADDTQQDWTEWKILSGGGGVSQASAWTSTGAYAIFGVAIKPSTGAAAPLMPPVIY